MADEAESSDDNSDGDSDEKTQAAENDSANDFPEIIAAEESKDRPEAASVSSFGVLEQAALAAGVQEQITDKLQELLAPLQQLSQLPDMLAQQHEQQSAQLAEQAGQLREALAEHGREQLAQQAAHTETLENALNKQIQVQQDHHQALTAGFEKNQELLGTISAQQSGAYAAVAEEAHVEGPEETASALDEFAAADEPEGVAQDLAVQDDQGLSGNHSNDSDEDTGTPVKEISAQEEAELMNEETNQPEEDAVEHPVDEVQGAEAAVPSDDNEDMAELLAAALSEESESADETYVVAPEEGMENTSLDVPLDNGQAESGTRIVGESTADRIEEAEMPVHEEHGHMEVASEMYVAQADASEDDMRVVAGGESEESQLIVADGESSASDHTKIVHGAHSEQSLLDVESRDDIPLPEAGSAEGAENTGADQQSDLEVEQQLL